MSTEFNIPESTEMISTKSFCAEVISTEDGSPTLSFLSQGRRGEAMHSLLGALSESVYIYLPVIQWVSKKRLSPHFFFLGLGLGYLEMMATAHQLAIGAPLDKLFLQSWEAHRGLQLHFQSWVLKKPSALQAVFDRVCQCVAAQAGVETLDLRSSLQLIMTRKQWEFPGALTSSSQFNGQKKFTGIFYDAFCSKTSPELWEESFLRRFVEEIPASQSCMATYASTRVLKESLKTSGFDIKKKAGFGRKRESTWAIKYKNSR